jgi:hypothetical protein
MHGFAVEAVAAELEIGFRLPLPDWPRAVFQSDYTYDGGRLVLDGALIATAHSRTELERGISGYLPGTAVPVTVRLRTDAPQQVTVAVDGREALREDRLRARPTRSAWTHAGLALSGSALGFTASYLYLLKAALVHSDWEVKMGQHMAGWHLLLTFTLFPASVFGQRVGIRAVQWVSALFFCIHAGIALANLGPAAVRTPYDTWIAVLNAASGMLFFVTVLYGWRAYRDMDPIAALRSGRTRGL